MILRELIEKRNKLWADVSVLLKGEVNAETRTKYDAMMAEVGTVEGDISRLEAFEKHHAELRAIERPSRPNPGESNDPDERAEVRDRRQKDAFRNYMRTGAIEFRDLNASGQAIAIPVGFNPQVIEAQKSYGQLYDIVDVVRTDNGEPIKYVLDNDTTNGLTAVTSGTDASETDPTLSGKTLSVDNFTTGVIKVDFALLQDSGFDIDSWVRDRFAMRFFRGASALIYSGNGANVGSLSSDYGTSTITSATAGKLTYADIANAVGSLDPAFQPNATWACNNATFGVLIAMSDLQGRPLFIPYADGPRAGFPGTILGRPLKLVTQMDGVTSTKIAMWYGDFKQAYVFRQVNPGLGILRLNERYAAGFQVGFVGFARVGGMSKNIGLSPLLGIKIQ